MDPKMGPDALIFGAMSGFGLFILGCVRTCLRSGEANIKGSVRRLARHEEIEHKVNKEEVSMGGTCGSARAVGSDTSDIEVEAVLAEFDGDVRRAIRALLDDIAALAEDRAGGRNFLKAYGHLELVR